MSFEFRERSHQQEAAHMNASLFDEAYEVVARHANNTVDWIERTAETALDKIGSLLFVDDDFDPRSGDRIGAKYGFGEDGSEVTVGEDGTRVTVTADGQKVTEHPDGRVDVGSVEIDKADERAQ
jgi:hypothetical protein